MISFFQTALDSLRTKAVMTVILAFVGGLLSVCMVEAARKGNRGAVLIKNPMGSWLVFNLLGGAVVWQIVIIPAFLHWGKKTMEENERRKSEAAARGGDNDDDEDDDDASVREIRERRYIADEEVVAIPAAVAVGYYLLSILMIVMNTPWIIGLWLFFPIFVAVLHIVVRQGIRLGRKFHGPTEFHLESTWWPLIAVYALSIICSVIGHVFFLWHILSQKDDRTEETRSTIKFIEIDIQYIFWTVLYWMLVEVGWKTPALMLGLSVLLGPGAGTCLGWLFREKEILEHWDDSGVHTAVFSEDVEGLEGENTTTGNATNPTSVPTEATPLLR